MRNKIAQTIAYLLPWRLVYFAVVRAWAHSTTGKHSKRLVYNVTVPDLLDDLEEDFSVHK